ncbi:hypothetical protein RhiLY_09390 [Ceratobasidium sp. AG-Ba]|nr:hypothetical protein RhiLY_09390 [Ceratobasidium sp. AG-Ba]
MKMEIYFNDYGTAFDNNWKMATFLTNMGEGEAAKWAKPLLRKILDEEPHEYLANWNALKNAFLLAFSDPMKKERAILEMSCQRPSARKIRNSCSASVKIPACQSRRRSRNQFGVPVSGQETVYSGTLQASGSSCDWQLRSKFLNPPQHKSKYIEKCA